MKYIDLTHTFESKMPIFPGDTAPELVQVSFVEKDGASHFQIKTGMHVGTHMDAPYHMLENGKKLSEYPPEYFFGRGHLIDARGKAIDVDLLEGKQIVKGDIVLIMAGLDKKFMSPEYYESYPEISEAFALKVVEFGVKIVGMDTPSPDRSPFAVHKLLLGNDILIIENLANLEKLIEHTQFDVVALPAKFDAEAAPARVVARI